MHVHICKLEAMIRESEISDASRFIAASIVSPEFSSQFFIILCTVRSGLALFGQFNADTGAQTLVMLAVSVPRILDPKVQDFSANFTERLTLFL